MVDKFMNDKRLAYGFGWGVVATVAMSVVMIAGLISGIAPMPKPVPLAIIAKVLGEGSPLPLLVALTIATHLIYGGLWGAILSALTKSITIWKGIGLGIVLWFIMQVVALPFLGWGLFGIAITSKIAVATFVIHLVYGVTLGWLMDRKQVQ